MKNRRDRIADREGEAYEWGWLQNKLKSSGTHFACVNDDGLPCCDLASNSFEVRPVFRLKFNDYIRYTYV